MCLYTNSVFPKKAKKDIHVYKVLSYYSNIDGYKTPYRQARIDSATLTTGDKKMKKIIWSNIFRDCEYELEEGIHSYTTFSGIQTNGVILEAIIPKGTLYYEDCLSDRVCSEKIIFTGFRYEYDTGAKVRDSIMMRIIARDDK